MSKRAESMSEIVVTPSGPGAMETGLMVDETGTRFVVLTFKEPGGDPVLVTFTVPIFQNWLQHLNRVGEAAADELNWVVGDDGRDDSGGSDRAPAR